ncbi:MAG: type VI secretion system baseplate subunit TssE [Deltaproteobacteria bacterium]|nr:type VI secretion system baseplate subunit TssE [Deltaproteobacteria bacterium]
MREERLLERLQIWEKNPTRRAKEDPRRIVDSVVRHLRRILNTKQGNVPIADDYGTPDFTDFFLTLPKTESDPKREIEKAIRLAIQKYEPRLKGVRVSLIDQEEAGADLHTDPLTIRFQITGRLASESKTQVFLETTVDNEGKINIVG